MLEYMLGKQGFQKGFQSFTENHWHKIGSLRNFQSEFEEVFKENNGCISNTSISEKGSEPKKILYILRVVFPSGTGLVFRPMVPSRHGA